MQCIIHAYMVSFIVRVSEYRSPPQIIAMMIINTFLTITSPTPNVPLFDEEWECWWRADVIWRRCLIHFCTQTISLKPYHLYVWKSRKTLRQWWATKDEGKGAKMVTILMILLFSPFTLCTPSVQQILRNTVLYFRYILMCKTIPLVPDAMNEWACKKRVVCCLF